MRQTDQIRPLPTTDGTAPKCTWAARTNVDKIALPARGGIGDLFLCETQLHGFKSAHNGGVL